MRECGSVASGSSWTMPVQAATMGSSESPDVRFWYNSSSNLSDYDSQPEHYMLLTEDIDQYISKINLSNGSLDFPVYVQAQLNCSLFGNGTNLTCSTGSFGDTYRNYWALVLLVVPILTLFGNVLVILSVFRERTLQTATNYFIVSLALADLLVAVVVMPFAVYVLVSQFFTITKLHYYARGSRFSI